MIPENLVPSEKWLVLQIEAYCDHYMVNHDVEEWLNLPMLAQHLRDLSEAEMKAVVETSRCAECGSRLTMPWGGAYGVNGYILRCAKDLDHDEVQKFRYTRRIYDGKEWKEYDVTTQKLVGQTTALAIPQTREAMLQRGNQALQAGIWPQNLSAAQKALMVQVALAYGLDPLMGELVVYQGKPLVTINARRRKDAEAGHHPTIKFRFLTADEKAEYIEAGAMQQGDLVRVGTLTTEWGNTVEATGKASKSEREATSTRSNHPRKLAHPIVADNPMEMADKRCEARLRLMAYGPIPLPASHGLPDLMPIASGEDVEGELIYIDSETGEVPEDYDFNSPETTEGMNDALGDDWTPESETRPVKIETLSQLADILIANGWTLAQLEIDLLHTSVATYLHQGHNYQDIYDRWMDAIS